MRPVAVFSALRLGLFAGCLVLLLALGARSYLAVIMATLLALVLSSLLLRRQRDSVARALYGKRAAGLKGSSFSQFLKADAAAEDEAADRSRREAGA